MVSQGDCQVLERIKNPMARCRQVKKKTLRSISVLSQSLACVIPYGGKVGLCFSLQIQVPQVLGGLISNSWSSVE